MAITVTCLRCQCDLEQPGGLLFSPPLDDNWTVAKDHLCATCYPIVKAMIDDDKRVIAWFRWAKDRLADDHEFRAVYEIVTGEPWRP